jgi:hypothetical protein
MTQPRQIGIPGLEPPPEERYRLIAMKAQEVAGLKALKDAAAAKHKVAQTELDAMLRAAEQWPDD